MYKLKNDQNKNFFWEKSAKKLMGSKNPAKNFAIYVKLKSDKNH